RLNETSQSLESEKQLLQQLTEQVESSRRQIDEKQQAFRDGQLQLNQLNQQLEQSKSTVLDLMRQLAAVSSRLSSIEIERKNVIAQQTRLADRRQIVVS